MVSLGGLVLALCLLFAGCSRPGEGAGAADAETRAENGADPAAGDAGEDDEGDLVPVETVRLATGEIEAVLRFSTNLEAESEVQVFSQASRRVLELLVEEGDTVRKDVLLLRLQDDEQRSDLQRVESQYRKARREYERQQSLYAQELISEQAINEATYEVEQLELAVADAQRNLSYTEVRAPISGTVTGRHVNLGDHVTVNQHLFDMVDFDTIVARIYVPEKQLHRLRVGQSARVYPGAVDQSGGNAPRTAASRTGAPPDVTAREGRVSKIAPIVDPRSGTVKVTVAIPRNLGLVPGLYVEVELVTEVHDRALLVPKRAVIYDSNQAFLYRLTGDARAERLRIEPLLEDREFLEPAPGSGLAVGDEIVVAGQAGLKSGVRVRRAGVSALAGESAGGGEASEESP